MRTQLRPITAQANGSCDAGHAMKTRGVMSLIARLTEDHGTDNADADGLACRSAECVIVEDPNPPLRQGQCLCSSRGRSGFVPRSKLLLLGYIQTPSLRDSTDLDTASIYEVPPGMLRSSTDGPATASQSQPTTPAWHNGAQGSDGTASDADYVVLVDQRSRAPASKASQLAALSSNSGSNGTNPSPILRQPSSLRSGSRRHSSTSLLDTPHSSGSSAHSRPVLRWAEAPNIIEIPSDDKGGRGDGQRLPSDGDYDDLNAGGGDGSHSGESADVLSPVDQEKLSKHTAAIRDLLRGFNAEAVRLSELSDAKVLLERIHWYIEDCSNRLLRFIKPRWKTAEHLAQTIPALYDACSLYHSMSQVFSTFVYVCMERSTTCEDKAISRKLLKHLRPLESHRQSYGNAIQRLEKIHWQPVEIERLAAVPASDYLGSLVASLRDINIEERSLYTTLVPSLEFLFPASESAKDTEEEEVFLSAGPPGQRVGQFCTLDRRQKNAKPRPVFGNQTLRHRPLPQIEASLSRWENRPLHLNASPPQRPSTPPTLPLSSPRRPPPPRPLPRAAEAGSPPFPRQEVSNSNSNSNASRSADTLLDASSRAEKHVDSLSTAMQSSGNVNNNNNMTLNRNKSYDQTDQNSKSKQESPQAAAADMRGMLDLGVTNLDREKEEEEESLYNTPAPSVESETYHVPPSLSTPASDLKTILKNTQPSPAANTTSFSSVTAPVSTPPVKPTSPVPVMSILNEPKATQADTQTFEAASTMRRSAIRNILHRMRPLMKKNANPMTPAVIGSPIIPASPAASAIREEKDDTSDIAIAPPLAFSNKPTPAAPSSTSMPQVVQATSISTAITTITAAGTLSPPMRRFPSPADLIEADTLAPLRQPVHRLGTASRLTRSASLRHPTPNLDLNDAILRVEEPWAQRTSASAGRLPVRFSDEVEVSIASEPPRDAPPASASVSTSARSSWPHAPEDSPGALILAAKVESHVELVVVAIENFLQCLGQDQPPNVFVQHSKFVVVSAQKLLGATDLLGSHLSAEEAPRVFRLAHQLCECLKAVVARTKEAAVRFPNPHAMRRMLNAVEAVSRLASDLKKEVERISSK